MIHRIPILLLLPGFLAAQTSDSADVLQAAIPLSPPRLLNAIPDGTPPPPVPPKPAFVTPAEIIRDTKT